MPVQTELKSLVVRPIHPDEEPQWDEWMADYHYLGFRKLVGESLKYVVEINQKWVALLGWGTAALQCRSRDEWIGWGKEQQWKRLVYVANNTRFLILPWIRIPNLASKILSVNKKRLSNDWLAVYGHPIVLAETFVDPSRFTGTCYRAAGWIRLGQTRGFGRNAGQYYYHGIKKMIYVYPLHRKACEWLSASFPAPELSGGDRSMDLNAMNLENKGGGLLERLAALKDPRKPRGIRHSITSTLAVAICAILSGARSYLAIGDWAAELSQNLLRRLGCRYNPEKRAYIPPSEPTIRRHLQSIDADDLDRITNEWLVEQTDPDAMSVDGKTLKGSKDPDGKATHLIAAFLHKEGVVAAQKEVGKKTNEITEFTSLLDDVDLEGKVVTADALHTQVEHARYLKEERGADYLFTVKDNQKKLKKAIEQLDDKDFSP